ncbi:hypothetical protein LTS03_012109, partial [Exophiala xenobiotica]
AHNCLRKSTLAPLRGGSMTTRLWSGGKGTSAKRRSASAAMKPALGMLLILAFWRAASMPWASMSMP